MKSQPKWVQYLVAGIGIVVMLLAIIYFYAAAQTVPTRPLVTIDETIPADGVAGQALVVFAQASDPDGIDKVELWVNGQQVAAQANPDADSLLPFKTSQAWIPGGAGNYLIVLKAIDREGFLGESVPFIVSVHERAEDMDLEGEYFVQGGETPEDIAALFGITPEELLAANPEAGEFTSGTPLIVPSGPEGESAGDAVGGPPDELEDIPRVDPPLPPTEPREAFDGEPASELWWFVLPLPDGFFCLIDPASCGRAIDIEPPPFPAPGEIYTAPDVEITGGCGIEVHWTDTSENEDGFRIYRFTSRPRFRMDLLWTQGRSGETGTHWVYIDENPPRGTFFYAVAAYNAGGDTWSAPSETVISEGCPPAGPVVVEALVVEALELQTEELFDRLYCYASLADSPFERIPYGTGFITIASPAMMTWDIAEHFSGVNKREVFAPSAGPLNVVGECLAWQGEELINLGRFGASHPPDEWDGRLLTSGPGSGTFDITYRINRSFHAADESGRAAWPLVYPIIPPPFNLHLTDEWARCTEVAGGRPSCVGVEEPGLGWQYRVFEEYYPTSYRVYRRSPGDVAPVLYYDGITTMWTAPLATDDCHERVFYSVSAVVGNDPITGEEIQSPLSEEFEVPRSCAALEVTLDFLWVYGVYDGDPCTDLATCRNDYEAYGWLDFNGRHIRWNDHCDPGLFEGCVYVGPSYSVVDEASEHNWADFNLNSGGSWSRENNVILVPIRDGESLNLMFTLSDHDTWPNGDDNWCGGTGRVVLTEGPHSAVEWLSFDEVLESDDGNCIIGFHVRGLPE
ncbi:MAG: hypothetical protein WEC37_03275 [Anaerolineales bacterium]